MKYKKILLFVVLGLITGSLYMNGSTDKIISTIGLSKEKKEYQTNKISFDINISENNNETLHISLFVSTFDLDTYTYLENEKQKLISICSEYFNNLANKEISNLKYEKLIKHLNETLEVDIYKINITEYYISE